MSSRHGRFFRAVALLMSWAMPGSTAWAMTPPVPQPRHEKGASRPDDGRRDDRGQRDERDDRDRNRESHGHGKPEHKPTPPRPPIPTPCEVSVFGPKTYVRTAGRKNEFVDTIAVPTYAQGPFTLVIENGEPEHAPHGRPGAERDGKWDAKGENEDDSKGGSKPAWKADPRKPSRCSNTRCDQDCHHPFRHRASAAWVAIDGVLVASPKDFHHHVATLTRVVNLKPESKLRVTIAGAPGSYLTIRVCGQRGVPGPPQLGWAEPLPGATTGDTTPRFLLRYAPFPGAPPLDLATLAVTIDGTDRTALFSKGATEAAAELPAELALAEGPHQARAEIKDAFGTTSTADLAFSVDATRPTLEIMSPQAGYLTEATVPVSLVYGDNLGLDQGTLAVSIDGQDRTADFQKTAGAASASLTLAPGGHTILASIRDLAGNASLPASREFTVDLAAPSLGFVKPDGARCIASQSVEVVLDYSDDQALDLASLSVTLDGQPLAMTDVGAMRATAVAPSLANGSHRLTASIADKAGRATSALERAFCVDTELPVVKIESPAAGVPLAERQPAIVVRYSDNDGVELPSFELLVTAAGVSQATTCETLASQASCTLVEPLPDGSVEIRAEVSDHAGNAGHDVSLFAVDTTPPSGAFLEPAAVVKVSAPGAKVTYSGTGSAVKLDKVKVLLDGDSDVTSSFVLGASEASGVLPSLADGTHTLTLALEDEAGNVDAAAATHSFVVDTQPPTGTFSVAPHTNDTTPSLTLGYDGTGSAVDTASVHVFLRPALSAPGDPEEQEITALLTIGAGQASGSVADVLADGAYVVRATFTDAAGNAGAASASFLVDSQAPTATVQLPVSDAFLATATPSISVQYQDEASGVDPETIAIAVDGVDRTARFTITETGATGQLLAEDALGEGGHTIVVSLSDAAGNLRATDPHPFKVDTTKPTVTIQKPAANGLYGSEAIPLFAPYSDADAGVGNAVDGSQVSVLVDGQPAPGVTILADRAEGALALADGPHTVQVDVVDLAGNTATALSAFQVSTAPPSLAITAPASGTATKEETIAVAGSVTGGAVVSVTVNGVAATIAGTPVKDPDGRDVYVCVAGCAFSVAAFPLADGATTLVATGLNSADKTGASAPVVVTRDSKAPVITISSPDPVSITNDPSVTVAGNVVDDTAITVTVKVEQGDTVTELPAACAAAQTGGCAFSVDVPLTGPSPIQITVEAVDAAGNGPASAQVTVVVDRVSATITISSPRSGDYVHGPTLAVAASAADDSGLGIVTVQGVQADSCELGAKSCSFNVSIPVGEGDLTLTGEARDLADNPPGTVAVADIHVDSLAPQVTIDPPQPNPTNAATILVTGSVQDASPVTATLNGAGLELDASGGFSTSLALPPTDGPFEVSVTATDAAQHTSSPVTVQVLVDRTSPALSIVAPVERAVIGSLPVPAEGFVTDLTPTTVMVNGQAATVTGQAWQASLGGLGQGPLQIEATATDAVPNAATQRTRDVVLDLEGPSVTIGSPGTGVTNAGSVTVIGSVDDAALAGVSVDGIAATVSGSVFQAADGRQLHACLAGCSYQVVVPIEPGDTTLVATAVDAFERTAQSDPIVLTRDSVPPQVSLEAPAQLVKGQTGPATAIATDNLQVARVVIRLNGAEIASCATATCEATVSVPEDVPNGSTMTVEAQAWDTAGNTAMSAPASVKVGEVGAVVGQVLDDRTGWPLSGASVRLISGEPATPSEAVSTSLDGKYSLKAEHQQVTVEASREDYLTVERSVQLVSSTGTVPVDARLTALAPAQELEADMPLSADTYVNSYAPIEGIARITSAAATIETKAPIAGSFRLTPLSGQGLPNLLPLGWSPVVAFDLRGEPDSPWTVTASGPAVEAVAASELHLAQYDATQHAWVARSATLAVSGDAVSLDLPGTGAFAVVVADDGSPAVPAPVEGEPLEGRASALIPDTAASTGWADPAVLPPTDPSEADAAPRRAVASVLVQTTEPLPSGTVVQAQVAEAYTLASGEVASRDTRTQDILLYRHPHVATEVGSAGSTGPTAPGEPSTTPIYSTFPIRPSRSYTNAELRQGEIVIDILAGRDDGRGVLGGANAAEAQSDAVRLGVAAGSLPADTALAVVETAFSSSTTQVPTFLKPLAELDVDLSGQVLSKAAQASVSVERVCANAATVGDPCPADGFEPGQGVAVAKVERVAGLPRLAVVAMAEVVEGRLVTKATPGLPGVTEGGRYVFYRLTEPIGFIAGQTTAAGTPVAAVVALCRTSCSAGAASLPAATDWPFVGARFGSGLYAIATPVGSASLVAFMEGTSHAGTAPPATVLAGAVTPGIDIALEGVLTTATVTPADGTLEVRVTSAVEIVTSAPINPATLTTQTVRLVKLGAVESDTNVRFVLSASGRNLSVIPVAEAPPEGEEPKPALDYRTSYRLVVSSGLHDIYNLPIAVPPTTFTTRENRPPEYDLSKLTFELPGEGDTPGVVRVKAPGCWTSDNPEKCLWPGTEVLIINASNGHVLWVRAGNLGEIEANNEILASIDDVLVITVTDPFGNSTTYRRSEFVERDAAGNVISTAVGPGGGTVTGPNGTEMHIPEGALTKGVKFTLNSITEWDEAFFKVPPDFGVDDQDQPVAHFGSALEMKASAETHFASEVDLAFPVPQEAVAAAAADGKPVSDAFFYVLRRVVGPCQDGLAECPDTQREVQYETVDVAKVEGTGDKARVVTASYPYHGLLDTWNTYTPVVGALGGLGTLLVQGYATANFVLMWEYNRLLPAQPSTGVVTGRVVQPVWEPGASSPKYVGQPNKRVVLTDINNQPIPGTSFATTDGPPNAEGRFTFNVRRFVNGVTYRVATDFNGTAYSAEVIAQAQVNSGNEDEAAIRALKSLGATNVATATIVLPVGVTPPAPPPIQTLVMTVEPDGTRKAIPGGTVVKGTPLLIGFKSADARGNVATVTMASINGAEMRVEADVREPRPNIPVNFVLRDPTSTNAEGLFTPLASGVYTITSEAEPPLGGAPVKATHVLRVTGEGGGIESLAGPPMIRGFVPKDGARGVSPTTFVDVAFTEPVKKVYGQISIVDSTGAAGPDLKLMGLTPEGVAVELQSAGHPAITSVTLMPQGGLKYGTRYKVVATPLIEDANTAGALIQCTTPDNPAVNLCESAFTTFAPESDVGEADTEKVFSGLAVLDNRAYALETFYAGGMQGGTGVLRVYDIDDPVEPAEVGSASVSYPPRDVAAAKWVEKEQQPDGTTLDVTRKVAAVVAMPRPVLRTDSSGVFYTGSTPGNLFLFNVDADTPKLAGACSLTSDLVGGIPSRVALSGDFAYVATPRVGIQTVDLRSLVADFAATAPLRLTQELWNSGHARDLVMTTRVYANPANNSGTANLYDLEAGSYTVGGSSIPVVFATGTAYVPNLPQWAPLVVVSSNDLSRPLAQTKVEGAAGYVSAGQAIALADVATDTGTQRLALVGGSGQTACPDPPGTCTPYSGAVLALMSVNDPSSPTLVSVVPLKGALADGTPVTLSSVGDILVTGTTAIVTDGARALSGVGGTAIFVSLANPLDPEVTGAIAGVGSRIALTEQSILLSTDKQYLSSLQTDLGGVRTAALGKLALVATDPKIIVVGEGPRSAETFKLKVRVIPSDIEVTEPTIEVRIDQVTHSVIPVTLTNGRGEQQMPFGYTFPSLGNMMSRVRLVARDELGQPLYSPTKAWTLEQPEVQLVWGDKDVEPDSGIEPKDEVVTADYPQIEAELVSPEWFRRFEALADQSQAGALKLAWQARSAPATMRAPLTLAKDGIHENELLTSTQAGAERSALVYIEDVRLGETDPVVVEAGVASEANSSLTAAAVSVPADGASEVLLTLDAKDQYGNPVSDGTVVVWEKDEDTDGEFVAPQEVTQGGKATVTYKVGVENGLKTVRAHVDDAVLEVGITQAPVGLQLIAPEVKYSWDRSEVILTVRASVSGGNVANNAQIGWFASIGRMEQIQPLTNGEAKARWRFGGVSVRPRVRFVAMLGRATAQHQLRWLRSVADAGPAHTEIRMAGGAIDGMYPGGALAQEPPPSSYRDTSVEPMMIVGDLTQDGYVPVERADGTFEDIFVKASATYRATGLVPGEHISVRLGTNVAPNMMPVAHYTGETVAEGVVPDVTGVHDGQATGVTTSAPGHRGQAFDLDGTGVIVVPHDEEFEFTDGFMVQTAVRPPPAGASGGGVIVDPGTTPDPGSGSEPGATPTDLVLLEKAGEYRLDLVEVSGELKARFTVQTASGEQSITSLVPVAREAWSLISGRYESGRIWIGIDNEASRSNDFAYIGNAPVHAQADLQIGPGFVGKLDEIRIFDLTRAPLSTFAGGQTALSFVADGTGTYEAPIVSTGQLALARTARYYQNLAQESLRLAQDEPPTTTLQEGLGSDFIEVETFWEDTAERSTTSFGYCTAVVMGGMVKIARGVLVGSEPGEMDLAVMAGDMLGSTLLSPVGIVRDLANATERMIYASGSGDDALNVAMGLITIAKALTKGKLGLVLQVPKLAKALRPGSRAASTVARIAAFEAKLAAGAEGVSKAKKLIEIAQASSAGAQMVGGILDAIGIHIDAVEAFNNIMSNAPPEEQQGVLEEIKGAADEFPREDTRGLLLAGARVGEQGSASADAAKAAARATSKEFWTKARRILREALKEGKVRRPSTILRKIAGSFDDSDKVIQELGEISHVANWRRLAKDLGHPSKNKRDGARFALRVATGRMRAGQSVSEIEKYVEQALGSGSRRRFYDLVVDGVLFECKRWSKFPPGDKALKTALRQFTRDLADIARNGGGPQAIGKKLRFAFPAELSKMEKDHLRAYFRTALDDKEVATRLRRYLRGGGVTREKAAELFAEIESALEGGITKIVEFY